MTDRTPYNDLIDDDFKIEVLPGAVVIVGPDAIAVALTVRAAAASAKLLAQAAQQAQQLDDASEI